MGYGVAGDNVASHDYSGTPHCQPHNHSGMPFLGSSLESVMPQPTTMSQRDHLGTLPPGSPKSVMLAPAMSSSMTLGHVVVARLHQS